MTFAEKKDITSFIFINPLSEFICKYRRFLPESNSYILIWKNRLNKFTKLFFTLNNMRLLKWKGIRQKTHMMWDGALMIQ